MYSIATILEVPYVQLIIIIVQLPLSLVHAEEKEKRRKGKEKKKKRKHLATSHPSVTGQTPKCAASGALDGRDWNHRGQLLSTRTSSSFGDRGNRRPGARRGSQESICVRSGPNPDSIIGEATFRPQSARRTRHLDFPPKPVTNSVFKPVSGSARPVRFKGHVAYKKFDFQAEQQVRLCLSLLFHRYECCDHTPNCGCC